MKRVMLATIGVMTLCVHSAASGAEIEGKSIDELCKILEENFDDPEIVSSIMWKFYLGDGRNFASYGHQEALGWARKVLREKKAEYGTSSAKSYLALKGDARDIDILSSGSQRDILTARVAGTNILYDARHFEGITWGGCTPSVTNMGPQAFYAHEILFQAWHNLEKITHNNLGEKLDNPVRDKSKIPAELMTVVVWFDDDGNPVCNVDLAKYGLTMPEIDLPQNVRDEILRRVNGQGRATASRLAAPGTASPYLLIAILAVLCAGITVWLLRRRGKK